MNTLTLEEQESKLMSFLSSSDIKNFLMSFDLYHCSSPNTQKTLFFKAAALLAHLSLNNMEGFYKLVQVITIDEISDVSIDTALKVFDCLSRLDFHSLKDVSSNCPADMKSLVESVYEKHSEIFKNALEGSKKVQNESVKIDDESEQVIKDCIFVVKNFIEN